MGRRQQGRGSAKLSREPDVSRGRATASPVPGGAKGPDSTTRHWAEALAERELLDRGWRLLARNYRLRGSELDLVCQDEHGVVVVVEVKQRRGAGFGGTSQAIDARKLSRLRLAAAHFMAFELRRPDAAMRFDAVLITGTETHHRFEHLRDIA